MALHQKGSTDILNANLFEIIGGDERTQILHMQTGRVDKKQGIFELGLLLLLTILSLLQIYLTISMSWYLDRSWFRGSPR